MSRTVIASVLLVLALPAAVAGPIKAQKKPAPSVPVAPALPPDPPPHVINDAPSSAETLGRLPQSDPQWGHYAILTAFELETAWRAARPSSDKAKRVLARAISLLATATVQPSMLHEPRLDEALFRLGALYQAAGQPALAMNSLKRLIKDLPLSRFVPDAYLSFGDAYFEKNDMELARKFYEKVAEFPKSRSYAYALYKTGWVDFNQGEVMRALQDFVQAAAASTDKSQATLHRAALQDSVLVYAKVGDAAKASAFYQRLAPGEVRGLLDRLAQTFADEGNVKAAETVRVAIAALAGQGKASTPAP